MNRGLLTILIFLNLAARVAGQEQTAPDTIPPVGITIDSTQNPSYVELWPSDTSSIGPDSTRYFQQAPRVTGDTTIVVPDYSHDPSRALMLALVLPGLGQSYNGKYWKMPIVWLAIGGAAYAISYNTGLYREYSDYYVNNPDDSNREYYLTTTRRYLELSYIAMIAIYGLQALDAYVDALLFNWDVNENLSMELAPSLQPLHIPSSLTGHSYGITCSFKFKGKWLN